MKWLLVVVEHFQLHFGTIYKVSKCPVLYDKYNYTIEKSMVVCITIRFTVKQTDGQWATSMVRILLVITLITNLL